MYRAVVFGAAFALRGWNTMPMSRGVLGLAFFSIAFVMVVLLFRVGENGREARSVQPSDDEGIEPAALTAVEPAQPKPAIRPATATSDGPARDGTAAPARPPAAYFVTADILNVRATPRTGAVVARAEKGESVRVFAVRDGWARLSPNGAEPRWVASRYLSEHRPPVDRYVTASELNLRSAPRTGDVVERIAYRTRVVVYETAAGWARLSPDGAAARWVAAKYLSKDRPPARYYVKADKLNIRDAPRTGKVLDRVRRGEELAVYAVRDGWGRLTPDRDGGRWAAMDHLSEDRQLR